MHLFKILLLLGACEMTACSKRGASYESRFHDEIVIEFFHSTPVGEGEQIIQRLDQSLRASKSGFVSGMMSSGTEIDFISIDTDFNLVDEEALVVGWVRDKRLPKGVKASYQHGNQPSAEKERTPSSK